MKRTLLTPQGPIPFHGGITVKGTTTISNAKPHNSDRDLYFLLLNQSRKTTFFKTL